MLFRSLVGAVGIAVAVGVWPQAAEAAGRQDAGPASIVVRTYTHAGWAAAMPAARRTVGEILERAGVEVGWLECGLAADVAAATACAQPIAWNELVVRIRPAGAGVDHPTRGSDLHVLGTAYVDLEAGGGSLATIYADRVEVVAESAGLDAAELLGRATAHEIGHLLLGTNRHAPRGLMRASWSSSELRRRLSTEWLFGGRESDVMRRGIASRR